MPVKSPEPESQTVRVWDLPTRLFRCSLVLTPFGSVVSGEVGGNSMVWHTRLGLVVLPVQVAIGLVADNEVATTGPLNRFVSIAVATLASAWHGKVGKSLLIVRVLLHVAAVQYYLWCKRRNLIAPMIHGIMVLPANATASTDGAGSRLAALVVVAAASALAWWVGSLGSA